MADTTTFTLTNTAWVDISTTLGLSGFLSNNSEDYIIYRQDDTPPSDTLREGHILKPKGQVNYTVTTETVYARSEADTGVLTGTAGTLS
jgi:hypothetical protein